MDSYSKLTQTEPIAKFTVVQLCTHDYAEIDPAFVHKYFKELKKRCWYVTKPDGNYLVMLFNKNIYNPLLRNVNGAIKTYYALPTSFHLEFAYYGNYNFTVCSYAQPRFSQEILHYHSRSLDTVNTAYYQFLLTETMVDNESLTFPTDIANFLITQQFNILVLCGDDDKTQLFQVIKNQDRTSIKLGYSSWKNFCTINSFKTGDTIAFKFSLVDPHKRGHVFIVPPAPVPSA